MFLYRRYIVQYSGLVCDCGKVLVAALAINRQGQQLRAQSRYLIDITYYVMCKNCVRVTKE